MKPSTKNRRWTDPALPMDPSLGRLSYALFCTDSDMGRIIAARCPDRSALPVGGILQDILHISPDSMEHLHSHERDVPLFVLTDMGLGILSGRYTLQGGMGLFLHIHCHPQGGARLINSGVLGYGNGANYLCSQRVRELGGCVEPQDEASYGALLEAWQTVAELFDVFRTDSRETIPLPELQKGIQRLAVFAGVNLTYSLRKMTRINSFAAFRQGRVHCYRPRLLESMLLYLLTELRDRSATRQGTCRMEVPEDNSVPITDGHMPLRLVLHYPVFAALPRKEQAALTDIRSYTARVADASGMALRFLMDSESTRPADAFPKRIIWLEWVENPDLVNSTDFKAGARLLREEMEPPTVDLGEEIVFDE